MSLWQVFSMDSKAPPCVWHIILVKSDAEGTTTIWDPIYNYPLDPTYIYLMSYLDPIVHAGNYMMNYCGEGTHWKLSDYTPDLSGWWEHDIASFLGLNSLFVSDAIYIGSFNLLTAINFSPEVLSHLVNRPYPVPIDLGGGFVGSHFAGAGHYYFDPPPDGSIMGRRVTVYGKCI